MEGTPIIPRPLYMPRGDIPLGDMPLGATLGCEALCVWSGISSGVKITLRPDPLFGILNQDHGKTHHYIDVLF